MDSPEVGVIVLARERTLRWFQRLIDEAEGYRVAGAFTRVERAVPAILESEPRLVLLELGLPGAVEIDAVVTSLRRERSEIGVIVVSDSEDKRLIPALRAGADGHLAPRACSEDMCLIFDALVDGLVGLDPVVARRLVEYLRSKGPVLTPPPYSYGLTGREREILEALVEGKSDAAVAERLAISPHTVRAHVKSMYRKLGVSSRAAAVAKALREELL